MPVGRVVATGPDPPSRMPMETASAEQLKANFASKGFTVQELVILSGAHTIGRSCLWVIWCATPQTRMGY